jgi:hypothetical protein
VRAWDGRRISLCCLMISAGALPTCWRMLTKSWCGVVTLSYKHTFLFLVPLYIH